MAGINIAVDAMGGDNAPAAVVGGSAAALFEQVGFSITLVGREELIYNELAGLALKEDYLKSGRLNICRADEIITDGDAPAAAIKEKKDSSMVVCLRMLKEGEAQAAVSAGNTGALLTGGLLVVGRINGILRPALGVMIPTRGGAGYYLLIDAGANMDTKPAFLAQFARLGSVYMESLFDMPSPRVGLINVGTEIEKGNALTKEAYPLLQSSGLNFIGNVETGSLSFGGADVAVCDGFVGNVMLKNIEGISKMLFSGMTHNSFDDLKKSYDPSEVGGAPFLGLNGLVVKTHGNAGKRAWMNAILKAVAYTKNNAQNKLNDYFSI